MKRPSLRKPPHVFTDRAPSVKGTHIVHRTRADRVVRVGLESTLWQDPYHRLLTLRWGQFFLLSAVVYLLANLFFATLYFIQPGSIANTPSGSFKDAFFFSVGTFATLGYGTLEPATTYAKAVMTLETLVGLMTMALTTGILFARVSRPTARVMFSRVAVVAPHDGQPTLMVRMGNERRSRIVDANVSLSVLCNETTREGRFVRRLRDLRLVRERTPIFALSFTAMHVIDATSPLYGMGPAEMAEKEIELLVTVTGVDEVMGQTVHARASYVASEIRFDHRYVDIFGVTEDGRRAIDYTRFHDTEQVSGPV